MSFITQIRNKVLVTVVRWVAGSSVGASNNSTHQDETRYVQSRETDRTIKVHVYKPSDVLEPSPVLINFHGSGFVMYMHGTDDEYALRVARDTHCTVLDVQYRLAPEHPYPAALHDAEDVIRYVLARPQEFDAGSIAISGFSAGGNFALGLSGHVFPQNTFRHVLAFYPPTDLAKDPRTKVAPDTSGEPLATWMTDIFNDCYIPEGTDKKEPLISPYYIAGDKFPASMFFITCAQDNLAPETEELVDNIKRSPGKHVVHRRVELCGHAWDKSYKPGTPQEKAKDDAYTLAVEFLNKK
ncbi:hypothetical protein AAFC00_005043 [Neodothiora populina]|uniref:Alpha/beta hydrolase fold-3 domain-containing protein n=1 Tax=Neodothiora populina TaxID=2781224 RepID=A0ABR3PJY8_9PEZI